VSNTARSGNVSLIPQNSGTVGGSLFGWRKSAAAASSKSLHWEINGRMVDNKAQTSDREGAHRIPLAELMNYDATIPKNGVE
jgi:hypothetical protein